jgi:hypothetical protein
MLIKRVAIMSTIITTGLLALCLWRFPGAKISLSLVGGDVMGLANFFLLGRMVEGLLGRGSAGKGRLAALFFFKLAALAALFAVVLALPVHPVAFLAGLSAVVVAITVAGLWANTSIG